jgi:hypothetical protein
MTSNDGNDARTHHEGRKRERAKRKGGVLAMQRQKEEKERSEGWHREAS